VLRHRLITNYNAEADGVTTDDLIDRLLALLKGGAGAADAQMQAVVR
jgi:hypothetical protein